MSNNTVKADLTLYEVRQISKTLRDYLQYYSSSKQKQKPLEANSYLPVIRFCCNQLGADWEVMTGIKSGYLFALNDTRTDNEAHEPFTILDKIPQIAVQADNLHLETVSCATCGKPLRGKRKDAKYCSAYCKNNAR